MSEEPLEPDSHVVARASEWIRRLQNADIDYAQLSDNFPVTQESARWGSKIVGPLGEPLRIEHINRRSNELGITTHHFNVTFQSGKIRFDLGLFADGKINMWGFKPLPDEPSPLDYLLPSAAGLREHMTPKPNETAQAMVDRVESEILEAHKRRIDSMECN